MSTFSFYRRAMPLAAIVLTLATAGCWHGRNAPQGATTTTVATAAPVYPGSHLAGAGTSSRLDPKGPPGNAFTSSDSFDAVYNWYRKNLPAGSERRHTTSPSNAAVFVFGTGEDRLGVTVEAAPLCCKTVIVIGRVKA